MKEQLLEHSKVLHPSDEGRVVSIEFYVPDPCMGLEISLDYSPKVLVDRNATERILAKTADEYVSPIFDTEKKMTPRLRQAAREMVYAAGLPLKNLITLSIYDSKGRFVGSACRFTKDSSTFEIGTMRSSPGFYQLATVAPGTWRLECEIRSLITESCKLEVRVHVLRGDETAEKSTRGKAQTSSVEPPRWDWYAGELHVHSEHSDGSETIARIVERAKEEGYDFIALTDHNTMSGHVELQEGVDFPVLGGIEFTTFQGHATALGLHSFVDWMVEGNSRNINSLIDDVHLHGALFSIAHPNQMDGPICTGCRWRYADTDYSRVDLIEVWCGSNTGQAVTIQHNFALWNNLLNKGNRIVGISGRDWHELDDSASGQMARTFVWTSGLTETEILAGLRSGRVYVSAGPRLGFSATSGSEKAEIGSLLSVGSGKDLMFNVEVENLKEDAELQIVKNSRRWKRECIVPKSRIRRCFSDVMDSNSWYRLQLVRKVGGIPVLLAFTNPIHVAVRDE